KGFDTGKIREVASDIRDLVDEVDTKLDGFLEETKEKGEPAGDAEPIGMLLGASYAAAEEVLVEGIESVTSGLEAFADNLDVLADSDDAGEHANESTLPTVEV